MLGAPVPVLPPKENNEESANTGVTLPISLKRRLEEVARESGYSRNEVIVYFLRWALRAYESEKPVEESKRGSGPKKGH